MAPLRLTMAQALVRYLGAQMTEVDGAEVPLFAGVFAIFGHGNVAGLGEALHAVRERLPTWRAHNEQAMAHAAIAFAKAHNRRRQSRHLWHRADRKRDRRRAPGTARPVKGLPCHERRDNGRERRQLNTDQPHEMTRHLLVEPVHTPVELLIERRQSILDGLETTVNGLKPAVDGVKSAVDGVKSAVDGLEPAIQSRLEVLHRLANAIYHVALLPDPAFDKRNPFLHRCHVRSPTLPSSAPCRQPEQALKAGYVPSERR